MYRRCLCFVVFAAAAIAADPAAAARARMVQQQIEDRGVKDARVLKVMREVPRHLFMPEEVRHLAHEDQPVPIGRGQTISQPYIVGFMTELLKVAPDSNVLEIGTGSGYQAAVLGRLANHVYTIEIVPELAAWSTAVLKKLEFANVTPRLGDGYKGWPERAPFDRIILTAAPPEIPKALIDQLKPGGRLVAPVGRSVWEQELVVIDKSADGKLNRRSVLPVRFVPMVPGKQPN